MPSSNFEIIRADTHREFVCELLDRCAVLSQSLEESPYKSGQENVSTWWLKRHIKRKVWYNVTERVAFDLVILVNPTS